MNQNIVVACLLWVVKMCASSSRPNIVIILADDMGFNDVSFHGSDQIPTPNIDALAYNGIILNNHYVLPICTPSRSALMTGLYPIHTGMQGIPILATEPRGLPKLKIMPQFFKDLGYTTSIIGKWHLGYHREDYTPLYRGFDSFFGYYNGYVSYYDYVLQDVNTTTGDLNGFDLRRNTTPAYDMIGKYATDVFTDAACETIRTHDQSKPLFLYMSHLAVHAGNRGKLLEAPQEEIDKFRHIADPSRRTYAAMVSKLDESVGRVVDALEDTDMLKNSIILFMADNGAPTVGIYPNWGSNYPLRGVKETLWEGGVRGAAMIWSPLLNNVPRVSDQLIHMTDWLPTLYSAAGGSKYNLPPMDGIDQWRSLTANYPSRRTEILLNIDEDRKVASIRRNNWKLVIGTVEEGKYDDYFGEGTNKYPERNPPYDLNRVVSSRAHLALERMSQKYLTPFPTSVYQIPTLRQEATVTCNYRIINSKPCLPIENNSVCLYDITNDPCERNNLTPKYRHIAQEMYKRLIEYRKTLVPRLNKPGEPRLANPLFFNGTWSTWYDLNDIPLTNGLT